MVCSELFIPVSGTYRCKVSGFERYAHARAGAGAGGSTIGSTSGPSSSGFGNGISSGNRGSGSGRGEWGSSGIVNGCIQKLIIETPQLFPGIVSITAGERDGGFSPVETLTITTASFSAEPQNKWQRKKWR
jgi:hypothetical protein